MSNTKLQTARNFTLSVEQKLLLATDTFIFLGFDTWPKNLTNEKKVQNFKSLFTEPEYIISAEMNAFTLDDLVKRLAVVPQFPFSACSSRNITPLPELVNYKGLEFRHKLQLSTTKSLREMITYDMQWTMLIVDFFPQNLKAKAWQFLTTIL
jgi:hypothetical protein